MIITMKVELQAGVSPIEFDFNDYECTAYWNGTGHMMWKYKPGWESGLTGRYENGVVKDWGGDRKRIKPLDTPPTAPP